MKPMTTGACQQIPWRYLLVIVSFFSLLPLSQGYGDSEPCDEVPGRTESSVLYVSYSQYMLSVDDILHEDFSDFGINYEDGIFCDPAIHYAKNHYSTHAMYLEPGDVVDWDSISTKITMLNITLLDKSYTEFDLTVYKLHQFRSLQSLALRGGILDAINSSVFEPFQNLGILDLSDNAISVLPRGVLRKLSNLMLFLFHRNPLTTFYPDLFCNLPMLFSINMNNVFHSGEFPTELFSSLAMSDQDRESCSETHTLSYIQIVRLSLNTFHVLPNASMDRLRAINNELQIAGSAIQTVEPDAFLGLAVLEVLILDDNNITHLPIQTFHPVRNLVQLTIANNSLQYISGTHFGNNSKVNAIELSKNNLDEISGTWQHMTSLIYFAANYNQIKALYNTTFSRISTLRQLYLRGNRISMIEAGAFEDLGNFNYFDLYLSQNELTTLQPGWFKGMTAMTSLHVDYNNLSKVDPELFSNKENLNSVFLNDNNIRIIEKDTFAQATRLIHLDLSNNGIEQLPSEVFANQIQLEMLGLAQNKFSYLQDELFQGLPILNHLYLDSNNLRYLNGSLFEDRSASLSVVSLHDNPWNCTCTLFPLLSWVQKNTQKVGGLNTTICQYPEEHRKQTFTSVHLQCEDLPHSNKHLIIAIVVVVVVMFLLLVLVVVLVKFRVEIEVLIFIKFNIRLRKPKGLTPEQESIMTYDGFISFNQDNLQFVTREMMPKLERECDPPFKLNVHFRDFRLGIPIADNITEAIDNSSRIIMLVSKGFLQSEWCREEFLQAHYKVMNEGKGRLIIILLEDVDPSEIKDRQLKTYISTHTYLHRNDRLFWERLRFNMPQIPVFVRQQQSSQLHTQPQPGSTGSTRSSSVDVENGYSRGISTEQLVLSNRNDTRL